MGVTIATVHVNVLYTCSSTTPMYTCTVFDQINTPGVYFLKRGLDPINVKNKK